MSSSWKDPFLTASGESDVSGTVLLSYGVFYTLLLLITAWVLVSAWKDIAKSNEPGGFPRLMAAAVRLLVMLMIVLWFFFS